MTDYFISAFIYLVAAVIAVPLSKRLGLGSVLGYLIAGVVIGPLTGLVGSETTTIQHFAEFGVVMMLFLVGLELEPKMLWTMRHRLLGLGGLQVGLTAAAFMGIALLLGQTWQTSLTIGMILSLSSTAIVLQTFSEKNLNNTEGGRASFSVLLFQDIAVIPMLAVIPLLALPALGQMGGHGTVEANGHDAFNLLENLPAWAYGLTLLAAVAGVVLGGRFLSRPLFRIIAKSGLREMFTATSLMLIIGIAALMSMVGLSPALGTFLAGVMMANSEFRHELEADIEPFKGLLLGLFFITVGAGLDFNVIEQNLAFVLLATLGVIAVKACLLFGLAKVFKLHQHQGWLLTLSLAQAGEFGFVLLSFSAQNSVLPPDVVQLLSPVVALSMFLTPVLFIIYEKVILAHYRSEEEKPDADTINESDHGQVVIAGIGRFGQVVNRMLVANGIKTIVLDHDPEIIERVNRVNVKPYYGDASRPDLLHTAGVAQANMVVVALDDIEQTNQMVSHIKQTYPQVKVLARAWDLPHVYKLESLGVDYAVQETFYSAADMGREVLSSLGLHSFEANHRLQSYLAVEKDRHSKLYELWIHGHEPNSFDRGYIELFIQLEKDLADQMIHSNSDFKSTDDNAWMPPPKKYLDEV